jgi:hypothetical protein
MIRETIYWGVLCRICAEPIAFGAPCHHQFELESAYAKPGALSCANGHSHIYFPRDFQFFASAATIPEAVMQANREAHPAMKPATVERPKHFFVKRWSPEGDQAAGELQDVGNRAGVQAASADPVPRRDVPQIAARDWWMNWALKKVS